MPDETPVAPSAAENSLVLDTFTEQQRSEWLKHGTPMPKDAADPAPALSEPAEPAEPIAPATDPGTVQEPRKNETRADKRIQELLRERAELRAKLDAAKLADKTADPAPAAAAPAAADDGRPVPPDPAKWTGTWEELETAKIKYFEDYSAWLQAKPERDRAAAARAAEESDDHARFDQWVERREAATAADPEFADANDIVGRFLTLRGVAPLVIDSEVGPEIVLHLYRLPQAEQERVSKLSPSALAREILRVEATLAKPVAAAPAALPAATPLPKHTSTSRKPATELSGAAAANTVDEAEDALSKGDFARYQRVMNARAIRKPS